MNNIEYMPKVSVIIPVYNTAPYLEDCINSIRNQTLSDIEILIVDDGSTDGSSDIIDKIGECDERILVIRQNNQGQSIARNEALKVAKGEYIYFMDSDDILNVDALSICLSRCEDNKIDIVFFDGDVIYEDDSKSIGWDYIRSNHFTEHEIYKGDSLIDKMLDTYTFRAVPWLYFLRREVLLNLNLTFTPNIIHEDELFTILLFIQTDKIGYINRRLISHRIRKNSTMTKSFTLFNVECYFEVIRRVIDFKNNNKYYNKLIEKYISYTMNGICRSAKKLTYKDRIIFFFRCGANNLFRYISIKNLAKLFI